MRAILRRRCDFLWGLLLLLFFSCSAHGLTTAEIAEKALPAVVKIDVPEVGQGSGTLIDPTGRILTCFHIIEHAKSGLVKTHSGGYFPLEGLLGFNPILDIAVVKVQGSGLPWLPLGDSAALKPGSRVVAIGSPKGLDNTVSDGVVSGLRKVSELPEFWRESLMARGYRDSDNLIQYTAPTTHGSSGGPLLNENGEIVGVVILRDPREDADNVYFAVPVDEAKPFASISTVTKLESIDLSSLGGSRRRIGPPSAELGLGAVQDFVDLVKIEETTDLPTYRWPVGRAVDPGSVTVSLQKTDQSFTKTEKTPASGQYQTVGDKGIQFSGSDIKSEVRIGYKARPKRVAILPVVNQSNIDYMPELVSKALAEKLGALGFALVAENETGLAALEAGLNVEGAFLGLSDSMSYDKVVQVAEKVNAAFLVAGLVGTESQVQGLADKTNTSGILLFLDGKTGKPVIVKRFNDAKNSTFSSRKSARNSVIRNAVTQGLNEAFGLKAR